MGRVRVEIDYHLDVDIWLQNDCLARTLQIVRKGLDVSLRFPPFSDSGSLPRTMDDVSFDGYTGSAEGHISHPLKFWLAIDKFRVSIRNDVEGISLADLQGSSAAAVPDLVSNHEEACREVADRLAIDFLDCLRCRGQTWLGPIGTISHTVLPGSTSYDEETNYRFKCGLGGIVKVPARSIDAAIDEQYLKKLKDSFDNPRPIPLAECFLADADFFLGRGVHDETQTDLQRAVLLAAISCEIKVKETLRSKVFPGGLPLVEALISNPRDFSMSAAGLFDKAMKAAVGFSLKESDAALYKLISALFERRNKVAHIGMMVDAEIAKELLAGARRVLEWLDKLPGVKTSSE